ncbi:hypothetical protein EJ03DRAFT_55813 [Teratosphaeria nubilosa]|uniref:Uncharacterized protein n=1 Tax=Teratosphaeria nubilosa TaxID=161662 RepID=A0A6G1LCY9_9PEZI|nr:hypothetical protein EJ03DRAFT_55813 [Teratosphaeria nubilosa]
MTISKPLATHQAYARPRLKLSNRRYLLELLNQLRLEIYGYLVPHAITISILERYGEMTIPKVESAEGGGKEVTRFYIKPRYGSRQLREEGFAYPQILRARRLTHEEGAQLFWKPQKLISNRAAFHPTSPRTAGSLLSAFLACNAFAACLTPIIACQVQESQLELVAGYLHPALHADKLRFMIVLVHWDCAAVGQF